MSNIELIEDYLTNRLSEADKLNFERQIQSDSSLKAEVELQKQIIEGVKRARVTELKAMLNNVPVGGSGATSATTIAKFAAAIVASGIIGLTLYHYLPSQPANRQVSGDSVSNTLAVKPADALANEKAEEKQLELKKDAVVDNTVNPQPKPEKDKAQPSVQAEPKLDVVDPSDELVDNPTAKSATHEKEKVVAKNSRIVVITNSSDKKYDFHYQFQGAKLVLYGAFDKSLYEILEIHGDAHAVFLYYKDTYYLLDEKRETIAALLPITDQKLLKKLKEYRESR